MNTLGQLLGFISYLLQLLIYIILAQVILSWLVAFNVINYHNRFVRAVIDGLDRIIGPLVRPIRRVLPDMGGIDLSPLLLVLAIILVQRLLTGLAMDLMM
ncbi:YggT family protein [Sandaracinobacteroides saxicola]|uniref:YggT family protein n=1 Tax=Sandaracinobacteroides saxicola TaxID=2759707 RepID=A0A7G5IJ61_9SPHN|nr:YggT family protein [Sandaracinobacteroides saxicola]QMW23403.1 YggT family protein [Sandaracinobacteroides saxicola]